MSSSTAPEGFYWSPCRPSLARAGRLLCVLLWIWALADVLDPVPGARGSWQWLKPFLGPLVFTLQFFRKPTLCRVSPSDSFASRMVGVLLIIGAAFLIHFVFKR